MRRATTIFWILTGLAAAFMLAASIPDVLQVPGAVATFAHLGFPPYLVPFIGLAKILGAVVILLPTFQVLKEWAYAGLVFDLTGALYSHICVGDRPSDWLFAIVGLLLVLFSYALAFGVCTRNSNYEGGRVVMNGEIPLGKFCVKELRTRFAPV